MDKNTKYLKLFISILIIFSPLICDSIVGTYRGMGVENVLYLYIAFSVSTIIGLLLIYKSI